MADELASLSGDLTGAVHAGVRLQAGMPLDLFEAAGIIARLRLEVSANVHASVTAAMSAGEMRGLVTAALPPEAAPYVKTSSSTRYRSGRRSGRGHRSRRW